MPSLTQTISLYRDFLPTLQLLQYQFPSGISIFRHSGWKEAGHVSQHNRRPPWYTRNCFCYCVNLHNFSRLCCCQWCSPLSSCKLHCKSSQHVKEPSPGILEKLSPKMNWIDIQNKPRLDLSRLSVCLLKQCLMRTTHAPLHKGSRGTKMQIPIFTSIEDGL